MRPKKIVRSTNQTSVAPHPRNVLLRSRSGIRAAADVSQPRAWIRRASGSAASPTIVSSTIPMALGMSVHSGKSAR